MKRLKSTIIGLLAGIAVAALAQPSAALTIFNDGGTHNVSSPQGDVVISNATTVIFLPGSSVMGLDNSSVGGVGVAPLGGSTLTIDGGSVTGGTGTGFSGLGGDAIQSNQSDVNIFSGNVTGGFKVAGGGFGGDALDMQDGTLNIAGGTVKGGDTDADFGGTTLKLGNVFGTITGGTFLVGQGGFSDGDLISAGGGVLDIFGGMFEAGENFVLAAGAVINVYGMGLMLSDPTNGVLTGTLADGNSINVNYSLFSGAVINLIEIPEPGMLALFGVGLIGLGLARRGKKA